MRIVGVIAFLAITLSSCEAYTPELVSREVTTPSASYPRLHHVANFASDFEMDHIIKTSFQHMKPQMQNTETGVVYELPVNGDPILEAIEKRLKSVVPGVGLERDGDFKGDGGETLRVRRYLDSSHGFKGGDYHPPHTDWYERPGMGKNDALLVTLMIYMSTPEEGGQTEFPDAFGGKTLPDGGKGYRFQPKRGDLAVWWSCDKKGKQDMKSMHSAVPVKKGIKWNATRFLYDHTKVCGSEAATSIQIPKAALDNKPQPSHETMHGTEMPKGIVVSAKGTYDTAGTSDRVDPDDGDNQEDEIEGGDPYQSMLDNEEYQMAFMQQLGEADLKTLAAEGMNDDMTDKMRQWLIDLSAKGGKDDL